LILAIAFMVWRLVQGQALLWCRKIKHLLTWFNMVQTSNISLNMFLSTQKLAWHMHVCARTHTQSLSLSHDIYCLKIKIHKTVTFPIVLYGCETWSLTLRQDKR
jgi:hypothetical protein